MDYLETTLEESLDGIFRVSGESFSQFFPRDKFLARLRGKKYWIYVAKEMEIVGFKIFYEDDDGQIYDWLDAVSPNYRNKGIATTLMKMEIDFARRSNYSKIKLKTHEGHPKMISLCGKFGFVEVKREAHHWKDTIDKEAIFFELTL